MLTPPPKPVVAMVLPPREGFAEGNTGAVGLLLERLAASPGRYAPVVVGMGLQAQTFPNVPFQEAVPIWYPAALARRYAGGVLYQIRSLSPALVEIHNRPDIALFLARRRPDLPVSLFLHNDPADMRHARSPRARAALLRRLARVVAVSEHVLARLHHGVPASERTGIVLPNCLDLRSVPPSPSTRENVLLFAGRVVADKGADAFVAACAQALPSLPGWRAEMLGADRFRADSPDTDFLRRLRPAAHAAGIAMAGYQPHPRVLQAMARAAIVVVPSRWDEPFGLTALEAMACGATLAYAPRGGLREVVGAAGIAIDPDDPAGMAAALVALARDPARRDALGEAGRRRAAGFDVRPAVMALDAVRDDILAAWRGRRIHPI